MKNQQVNRGFKLVGLLGRLVPYLSSIDSRAGLALILLQIIGSTAGVKLCPDMSQFIACAKDGDDIANPSVMVFDNVCNGDSTYKPPFVINEDRATAMVSVRTVLGSVVNSDRAQQLTQSISGLSCSFFQITNSTANATANVLLDKAKEMTPYALECSGINVLSAGNSTANAFAEQVRESVASSCRTSPWIIVALAVNGASIGVGIAMALSLCMCLVGRASVKNSAKDGNDGVGAKRWPANYRKLYAGLSFANDNDLASLELGASAESLSMRE